MHFKALKTDNSNSSFNNFKIRNHVALSLLIAVTLDCCCMPMTCMLTLLWAEFNNYLYTRKKNE